ncbi:MAG: hypothetical protein ACOY5B_10265 [Spirochaetota bacterium]
MKNRIHALLAAVPLLIFACKKEPQQPLEATTIDKVCTEAFGPFYDERKYVRYHRVSFSGYLQTPKSAMVSDTMFVDVYEKPNRAGALVRSSFKIGSGKNKVERLKDRFKESDLKIESNNGVALSNGSKVTIQGAVSPGGVPGKWIDGCYVKVETVEAAQ